MKNSGKTNKRKRTENNSSEGIKTSLEDIKTELVRIKKRLEEQVKSLKD